MYRRAASILDEEQFVEAWRARFAAPMMPDYFAQAGDTPCHYESATAQLPPALTCDLAESTVMVELYSRVDALLADNGTSVTNTSATPYYDFMEYVHHWIGDVANGFEVCAMCRSY